MWTEDARRRHDRRAPRYPSDLTDAERALLEPGVPRRRRRGHRLDPVGFDAGKKIKGRKRHLLVDTEGLMLGVIVHGAGVQDRDGAVDDLLKPLRRLFPWIEVIWADAGYRGPKLAAAVSGMGGWRLEIVGHSPGRHGFEVQPRRWVIERTIGWISRNRRLARISRTWSPAPSRSSNRP